MLSLAGVKLSLKLLNHGKSKRFYWKIDIVCSKS